MLDLRPFIRSGLVTRRDLTAAEVPPRTWRSLLDGGALTLVAPGVARVGGDSPLTYEQRVLAAVLSIGDDALASHRSAARLWDVELDVDEIDVLVMYERRPKPRAGVTLHFTRNDSDMVPSNRHGVPVTGPLRTLIDLPSVAPESVEATLVSFTTRGLVTIDAVDAVLSRLGEKGRSGVAALRRVVDGWPLGRSSPDSELEYRLAVLLRDHRVTGFRHHAHLGGFEVDFAHDAQRLVLETDGFEFHSSREAFEEDRRRDAELVAAGWRVVRFTWAHVTTRPEWVVDVIRQALSADSRTRTTREGPDHG